MVEICNARWISIPVLNMKLLRQRTIPMPFTLALSAWRRS